MIKQLSLSDVYQVACLHKQELSGFLPELGEAFLEKFYKVSLSLPEIFTLVEIENEQILGFVTGCTRTKGLYKKIIFKDIIGFATVFLNYFITHPGNLVKMVKILTYPGFTDDSPELLTIAIIGHRQRKGIGTKLFNGCVKEFRKRGIKKFRISVYDRLTANDFYKKIGCRFEKSFEFLEEKMNYYGYEVK